MTVLSGLACANLDYSTRYLLPPTSIGTRKHRGSLTMDTRKGDQRSEVKDSKRSVKADASMVCKLNEILKCLCCMLCSQLFEEATTVNLCLHTFCKRCVYQAVQETKNCPQCKKDLGSSPEEHLKDDERIQSITQKIQFLLTGKGQLESEANDVKQGAGTSKPPEKEVLDENPEEPSSFLFTFVPLLGDKRRRLRAIDLSLIHLQDSTMPVSAIQMYIAQKLNMEDPTEVDVVCCGEKLNGDMTVKDIQLIWMLHLPNSEGRKKNWDYKELIIELGYIKSEKPTTSQKK